MSQCILIAYEYPIDLRSIVKKNCVQLLCDVNKIGVRIVCQNPNFLVSESWSVAARGVTKWCEDCWEKRRVGVGTQCAARR